MDIIEYNIIVLLLMVMMGSYLYVGDRFSFESCLMDTLMVNLMGVIFLMTIIGDCLVFLKSIW